MFHQNQKSRYQKLLEQYELEQGQQDGILYEIILTLFQVLDRPEILSKYIKDIEIYAKCVRIKIINKQQFGGLNFGMMLHSFLMRAEIQSRYDLDNQIKILEFINRFLTQIKLIDRNTGQVKKVNGSYFHENILFPYYFYLQKKIQFLELKLLNQSQKPIKQEKKIQFSSKSNSLHFKQNQILKLQSTKTKLQKHYQQCYKIINLLNNGLNITPSFLTILRYYHSQKSLTLLNRLLATDFSKIYTKISQQVELIKKIQGQLDLESLQYSQLMKQIQKINQKMFIIFLNRYNGHQLSCYIPHWICIEIKYINMKGFSTSRKQKSLNQQLRCMGSCRSVQNQQYIDRKSRSKSSFTKTQGNFSVNNLQVETGITIMASFQNFQSQKQKQKQRLSILSELQNNFKKFYNKEPSNLKQKTRFKKNKSFYQVKIPQKFNL